MLSNNTFLLFEICSTSNKLSQRVRNRTLLVRLRTRTNKEQKRLQPVIVHHTTSGTICDNESSLHSIFLLIN